MKKGYVNTPEGQIHYRAGGSGEPLLLLHYTPVSSDEYSDMIPFLDKEYRVIAMDTLGYGNSDRPPRDYSIEDYAVNIVHFLDALEIGKTNILGHHTGASLGIELAATFPDRVNKLIISGVSLYSPEERIAFLNDPMYKQLEIVEDGSFLLEQWGYLREWGSHLPVDVRFRMIVAMLMAGERLHDAHYAAFRYDKVPKLSLIKCPTLILSGSDDMFCNVLYDVKKMIQRCRVHIVNAGNFLGYEKPEEFAQAALDFLRNPGV